MGGLAVLDDIRLIAPGPQTVAGGQAQRFGAPGMNDFNYWIVAHYPIGISISGPFFVRDAPNVLDPANYVLIVWDAAIGAVSYDVLRTATAEFPQGSGFFAVATGLTQTTARDQGQALTFYAPPAPPQSPATCRIHLNNRDYAQPTLQMPCSIAVTSIIFADGTQQSTAGGGGGGQNQTPWLSDIDGAGFSLDSVSNLGIGTTASPGNAVIIITTGSPGNQILIRENAATRDANIGLTNNNFQTLLVGIAGTQSQESPNSIGLAYLVSAPDFVIRNGAGERMRVAATGPIGIANPAPVYPLDIVGDCNITGAYRVNGVPIGAGGSQTPWTSNIDAAGFNLNNLAAVGIGTFANPTIPILMSLSIPGNLLGRLQNLSTTGIAGAQFQSDTNALFEIGIGCSAILPFTLQNHAFIRTSLSTSNIIFFTGTVTERLRIQASNGYIGIAVPGGNPLSLLHINAGSVGLQSSVPPLGSVSTHFALLGFVGASTLGIIAGILTNGNSYISSQDANITANQRSLLLQPNGGNLGINNQAPAFSVDVTGDINITGNYRQNGAIVALATQLEIDPLMTRIRALEDEVNHLTRRRRRT